MSEAAVLTRPRTDAGNGGSILIIDDEAGIRESLETLLEFEGYSVESAETGEDGLARLSERTFDLV
jgi:DNA-binding NtrC family response regulator